MTLARSDRSQDLRSFYIIVVAAVALKLWLTSEIRIVAQFGPHDASNFIEHARAITAGAWFGPYNDLTLIKQPFFPIYLALLEQFGISLTLAHNLMYALACLVACMAIKPVLRNAFALGGFFLVLSFNPMEMDSGAWLANRSQINPTLALFAFSFALGIYVRRRERAASLFSWFAGAGISFAAFMLTREEAIWIVPSVAFLLGLFLWSARGRGTTSMLRRAALVATVPAAWALTSALVMFVNGRVYGWAVTSENISPTFIGAYDSLARLNQPDADKRYPVPLQARLQAYRVSAAARELQPFLEGQLGKNWAHFGCITLGACTDIHAGWFIWAFRDSVAAAGHYSTATDARAFYQRLASEIDAACSAGAVACEPKAHTLSPPFTARDVVPLFANFFGGLVNLATFQELEFDPWRIAPSASVEADYDFLVGRTSAGEYSFTYSGWLVHAPLHAITVTGTDPIISSIDFNESPDVAARFGSGPDSSLESGEARFQISTTCTANCAIVLTEASGQIIRIPLAASTPDFTGNGVVYHLDNVHPSQVRPYDFGSKRNGIEEIGRTYKRLVPLLFVASILLLAMRLIVAFTRKQAYELEELTPAIVGFIASSSLIFLLAYISTVSFGAFYAEYMGASYPLLILAIYVTLAVEGRRAFLAMPSFDDRFVVRSSAPSLENR